MKNLRKIPLIALFLANVFVFAGCKSSDTVIDQTEISENAEVTKYIRRMNFDKDKVLAKNFGDKITLKDDKNYENSTEEEGLNLIVTHKEVKDVKNGSADIKVMGANTDAIYPGAIVKCDEHLLSDSPTPDNLSRGNVRLNIKLNGADEKIGTKVVKAEPGKVTDAINDSLNTWFTKGYTIGANAQTSVTQVHNSQAFEATFGMKGIANKFGISITPKQELTRNIFIVSYEQIYFSVVNDYTYNESPLYDSSVSLEKIQDEYPLNEKGSCDTPPVLVDNAQYGRTIYLKIETNLTFSEVTGAFTYLNQKVTETDPEKKAKKEAEIKLKFNQTMSNSSMNYLVYGGPSSSTVLTPIGSDPAATIIEKVKEGSEFKSFATGSYKLLSYSTKFLKDNTSATLNRASQYVETTRTTLKQQHLYVENNGFFVISEFRVEAKKIVDFDEKGKPIFEANPSLVFKRNGVLKHKGFHYQIPANYGQVVFKYDVKSGATWPFDGRVTNANFFTDASIYTKGTFKRPFTEITVDGVYRRV